MLVVGVAQDYIIDCRPLNHIFVGGSLCELCLEIIMSFTSNFLCEMPMAPRIISILEAVVISTTFHTFT